MPNNPQIRYFESKFATIFETKGLLLRKFMGTLTYKKPPNIQYKWELLETTFELIKNMSFHWLMKLNSLSIRSYIIFGW